MEGRATEDEFSIKTEKKLKAAPIGESNYPSAAAETQLGPCSLSHQDIVAFAN